MSILIYVLAVIIALAGVFFLFVTPVAGIILIVLGVLIFLWQKKKAKAAKEANRPTERRTYDIAGINYHADELPALGSLSDDYRMSAEKIVEEGREDEELYKYDFPTSAQLVPDPENEHDKNAIKVIIAGTFVGFVPAVSAVEVGEIISTKKVKSVTAFIEGGPFKKYNSDTEEIEKGENVYSGIVTVEFEK